MDLFSLSLSFSISLSLSLSFSLLLSLSLHTHYLSLTHYRSFFIIQSLSLHLVSLSPTLSQAIHPSVYLILSISQTISFFVGINLSLYLSLSLSHLHRRPPSLCLTLTLLSPTLSCYSLKNFALPSFSTYIYLFLSLSPSLLLSLIISSYLSFLTDTQI